ncbi:hypothetical protein QQF64_027646 [Cirrhinus molitorella]|uniref:Uncharacterized protein n=1 Tax=Cirrhinus molitorella TaxID=172907 RepID=A0ABR3NCZ7_9TELE
MWIIDNSFPPASDKPLGSYVTPPPPPSAHVIPTILLSITTAILVNTLPFAAHAANPPNTSSWAVREGLREREKETSLIVAPLRHTQHLNPLAVLSQRALKPLFTRRI